MKLNANKITLFNNFYLNSANKKQSFSANKNAASSKCPVKDCNPDLIRAYYGISFCSTLEKTHAQEFMDKLVSLGLSAKELVENTLEFDKPIGTGGEGRVYIIPGLYGFLLKAPHGFSSDDLEGIDSDSFTPVQNNLGNINVGQSILELGPVSILKKVNGISYNQNDTIPEELAYSQRLDLASAMPQQAYDNLVSLTVRLNALQYGIDPGIGNVLIERGKAFNPIDISFNNKGRTNLIDVLVLLAGDYKYARKLCDEDDTGKLSTVIKKCLLAYHKQGFPITHYQKNTRHYRNDMKALNEMFKIAEITINLQDLEQIYNETINLQDHQKFDNYLNAVMP